MKSLFHSKVESWLTMVDYIYEIEENIDNSILDDKKKQQIKKEMSTLGEAYTPNQIWTILKRRYNLKEN